MKRISKKLLALFLLFTILLSGWLYRESFRAFFFQDDWFAFRISRVNTLTDFFSFFIPRKDLIYYRPLGMQTPFFLGKTIFNLNPLPFHLLTFLTHSINIILVFYLVRLISDKWVAMLSAFFYATSAVHYIPFFWFATYAFVLGPTAFFLSFILFIFYMRRKLKIYLFYSMSVYILGLLINEIVVTLPLVILFYLIYLRKISISKFLLPYFFAAVLLFSIRFSIVPSPFASNYTIGVGRHLLNNIEAYLLWSFNWPEEMKAQLVNFFTINPLFVRDFRTYSYIFVATLLVSLVFFYFVPLAFMVFKKKIVDLTFLAFTIVWFVVGLIPVIFFPSHTFSYYLPISLVGLLTFSSYLFITSFIYFYKRFKRLSFIIVLIIVINWIIASKTTIDFNSKIHWAPRRAKISNELVSSVKKLYSNQSNISFIYIQSSSENKLALNNQDGLKVALGNENIITVYNH